MNDLASLTGFGQWSAIPRRGRRLPRNAARCSGNRSRVAVAILKGEARFEEIGKPDNGQTRRAQWPGEGGACLQGRIYQYKTKGHRVIAMPPCSIGLAPPAFTAPCRNQTNEPVH